MRLGAVAVLFCATFACAHTYDDNANVTGPPFVWPSEFIMTTHTNVDKGLDIYDTMYWDYANQRTHIVSSIPG